MSESIGESALPVLRMRTTHSTAGKPSNRENSTVTTRPVDGSVHERNRPASVVLAPPACQQLRAGAAIEKEAERGQRLLPRRLRGPQFDVRHDASYPGCAVNRAAAKTITSHPASSTTAFPAIHHPRDVRVGNRTLSVFQ